ncbi:hypothetical protein [Cardinium endosymbiont of Oedothorax gibbosus]|uniref:hypothetical protein n=1 Tax=Cardinium endosymbiont of Oedothorax gibbosus TaxID=931101 RepID=UPI002025A31B|nr:hypothetical protein [Cardinium endosymbiont of Oedothorax gibbosus]
MLPSFFLHAKEKIRTPHFSILFDKSTTHSAQRIANTLETIYQPVSKTLGVYPSPIRLVVNNGSTLLNGYFKHLPRHISFYTLHPSDPYFIGNANWFNMLCIHEFRHAVQHSIEYYSTPRWLRLLYFGCNLITPCGVPKFFKEGDAVGIETALSKAGRGRLPEWEKIYRVNLLERGTASFDRQLFGSLQHEMPSEYHIGYYFTTHIRRKYGADSIKSIFEKSVRSMPFFGFYHALKKVTKKSILKVYEDMNQELLLSWQKQLEGLKITPGTQLTIKKPNDSFDYINPFIDASGNLMAWKTGIGLRPQLVQVRTSLTEPATSKKIFSSLRKDKTIFYFIKDNSLPPAAFAIGEGCAAWLETCSHPWQENKQTNRLQYYDFKQKKRRTLISSSRYTALAMSPNTHQLVAVTTDKTGKHLLVVLEMKSGKVVKKIDNPDEGYYLTPSWSGEDYVIVVKTKNQQNSILRINVATSKAEILLPYTYEHRSYPRIYKDYLLYNSSYNGIDNIYAMHLPTKACFQVTSRKYGAYLGMVYPINHQLVFNDYTKNGMDIVVMPFDPLLWTPLGAVKDRSVGYYEPLVVQEQNSDILTKVPNHLYPLTKYCFAKDNLAFIGANLKKTNWDHGGLETSLEPFALVNLENILKATPYWYENWDISNDISNKVRNPRYIYEYMTRKVGLKVSYTTWYPILEVDIKAARYRWESMKTAVISRDSALYLCEPSEIPYWKPKLSLGIKLPYYFTLGSSSGEAYLEATIRLSPSDRNKKKDHTEKYAFSITNSSTKSKRDIHPPWCQKLRIGFEYAKESPRLLKTWYENRLYFNIEFYIPGIVDHHYCSLSPTIEWFKKPGHKLDWTPCINLVYGFPWGYPECGIPLIWFLEKIWIEGYYSYKVEPIKIHLTESIGKVAYILSDNCQDTITIGTKLYFLSRFLASKNIPAVQVLLDFPFFKKQDNVWKCQFPLPKLSFGILHVND